MQLLQKYFPIEKMAATLKVSRSGYYNFVKRSPSKKTLEDHRLISKIKSIHAASHQTYGSPRIHAELKARGEHCSRKRVARLMQLHQVKAKMSKKFKKTTIAAKYPFHQASDLVQRQFQTSRPNAVWVADISYVPTSEGWAYVAVVLDLFSRKIVGMAVQKTMKTALILAALSQAIKMRKPPPGLIHHSDQGAQYTSRDFYQFAQLHNIKLSIGKTGTAYDNAAMESFFHTLKTELTHFKKYQTIEEATMDIFMYIFTFYNQQRRHSTLNYQTPQEFETIYDQQHRASLHNV